MFACSVQVLNFIPSWFAINMGTGILSILLHMAPYQFKGLRHIATAFYILNIALFIIFSIASVLRYTMYPWVLNRMLRHPTICMFLGTIPMGLATIVNATVLIVVPAFGAWATTLVHVLWWVDVALSVLSCFGIPLIMFHIHQLQLETMTAVWLLPIVPPIVAAASGGLVATILAPSSAMVVIVVSYMLWGVGEGLSFMVLALYFHRLAVHNLPNSEVIVTAFLPLGPLGQGAAGLLLLAEAGQRVFPAAGFAQTEIAAAVVQVASVFIGLMMWGLGLWWLMHGVLSLSTRYLYGGLGFSMAMWGLVFPFGVFTSATIELSVLTPSLFLGWLSMAFIAILFVLWFFVAIGTVRNAVNKKLFVAPCLNTGPGGSTLDLTQSL